MDNATKQFYDEFWHKNVPNYEDTKKYMLDTLRKKEVDKSLDAGCGHGICSIILSEYTKEVTAVDISPVCIKTAKIQAEKFNRNNIQFVNEDLQELDLPDNTFDIVWCWGVAMMAPDPMKIIHNLFRVTKSGGEIYLGLYLKTWLSPVHQGLRHFFRTFMNTPKRKKIILDFFSSLTNLIVRIKGQEVNLRSDNISIQTQVDDWFYPPYKTFYSINEILELFRKNGFEAECIQDRVGRMKSATIFVIRGIKK